MRVSYLTEKAECNWHILCIRSVNQSSVDGQLHDLGGSAREARRRNSHSIDVEVAVKMPSSSPSVIRGIVQPFDWTVLAKVAISANFLSATVQVQTNLGKTVAAKFTRVRALPLAA